MKPFSVEFNEYSFPEEIANYPKWVVCDASKIPMYQPGFQQPLVKASPTDPKTWMSFEAAISICELNEGLLPGFVLTPDDPFTVLDLDVKDDTPPDHLEWYNKITQGANTYTEWSASGRGLHLWLLGNMGEGKRSSTYHVERYSQERFIICTGNVVNNAPIGEGNGVLQYMEQFLDSKARIVTQIADGPQIESDECVVEKIGDWENSELFSALMCLPVKEICQRYGYPSGSEADGALVNFLVKGSPNNDQVKRIFRTSALANRGPKPGQKDKIFHDDKYLDRTINNFRAFVHAESEAKKAEQDALIAMSNRNLAAMAENVEKDRQVLQQQLAAQDAKYEIAAVEFGFPPGPIGELAKWLYSIATLQVPIYAITTALAIATTLTAKGWRFRDKHLNAYYVIAGRSATGKNILHKGIGTVVRKLSERATPIDDLFCAADMRSTIAWRKYLIDKINYCQIIPEMGTLFEELNNRSFAGATEKRNFIQEQYSAGHTGVLAGGSKRSDDENSTDGSLTEVTLSLIGETTLESLFENLTSKMASSGFMSRFNFGVYEGHRVERNKHTKVELPDYLIDLMDAIFRLQAGRMAPDTAYDIPATIAAEEWLENLDSEILKKIGQGSGAEDETYLQIYNRVQERVERMAGTFAVFRNYENPIVDICDIEWAYAFVNSNTKMMLEKYKSGEVGEISDDKVRRLVASAIVRYFGADLSNSHTEMRYIPHQGRRIFLKGPIQTRCYNQLSKLESTRGGEKPGRALWRMLQEFTSEGLISPVSETEKGLLANPVEGVVPIVINKTTDAWFINDLEGLQAILA